MPVLDRPFGRSGFAVLEVVTVAALAVMVAALLLVAGDRSRRSARLGEDIADFRQIGGMTGAFAGDHTGLFWTFSWKKGDAKSKYGDLNNDPTDMTAAASQAVDILRRVAGREDIPKISNWFAHPFYSHLVLADYMQTGGGLPSRTFISSGDANRLLWAGDPQGFDQGKFGAQQPPPGSTNKRWPYSSSYEMTTAFFDKSAVGERISQAGTHATFLLPAAGDYGGKAIDATAFPSRKVLLHDGHARHFGRYGAKATQPFFSHPTARLPFLFVDASVVVHWTVRGNKGWRPNSPDSADPTAFYYEPQTWAPPTVSGGPVELVAGYMRWTRNFIAGRDFGGPEVGRP